MGTTGRYLNARLHRPRGQRLPEHGDQLPAGSDAAAQPAKPRITESYTQKVVPTGHRSLGRPPRTDVKPTGTPILLTFCCAILGTQHPHLRPGVSPDTPDPTSKFRWEGEQEGGRRGPFPAESPALKGPSWGSAQRCHLACHDHGDQAERYRGAGNAGLSVCVVVLINCC